jgi:Cupin
VFSEVLSGVRLRGAMFFSAEFSAPWRLSTPHCRVLAPTLAPGAPHIVIYHLVVDGAARASVEGGPDVELSPGDIVVFPHGDPHHLSGEPERTTLRARRYFGGSRPGTFRRCTPVVVGRRRGSCVDT